MATEPFVPLDGKVQHETYSTKPLFDLWKEGLIRNLFDTEPKMDLPVYPREDPF